MARPSVALIARELSLDPTDVSDRGFLVSGAGMWIQRKIIKEARKWYSGSVLFFKLEFEKLSLIEIGILLYE